MYRTILFILDQKLKKLKIYFTNSFSILLSIFPLGLETRILFVRKQNSLAQKFVSKKSDIIQILCSWMVIDSEMKSKGWICRPRWPRLKINYARFSWCNWSPMLPDSRISVFPDLVIPLHVHSRRIRKSVRSFADLLRFLREKVDSDNTSARENFRKFRDCQWIVIFIRICMVCYNR